MADAESRTRLPLAVGDVNGEKRSCIRLLRLRTRSNFRETQKTMGVNLVVLFMRWFSSEISVFPGIFPLVFYQKGSAAKRPQKLQFVVYISRSHRDRARERERERGEEKKEKRNDSLEIALRCGRIPPR